VANGKEFGGSKAPHFGGGSSAGEHRPSDSAHCAQCEAMLADAVDGTLSATDQAIFDIHMGHCAPCSQMLADARRGAAWLEMLRDPRPQPPAELLDKILAQTSGSHASAHPGGHIAIDEAQRPGAVLIPAPIYGGAGHYAATGPTQFGRILPFRSRFASAVRASALGQIMLQPRLAMTAAMAFFSIALTMDLTGVRLQDIRVGDLRPGSLKRDFYSANAHVVQYYEGLRVVYELESRVHDFESSSDSDAAAGQTAPPADNRIAPDTNSPSNGAGQPAQPVQPSQTPPRRAQPDRRRQRPPSAHPAPNSGTSRRDEINRGSRDAGHQLATLERYSGDAAIAEATGERTRA
jgi:hypothetical protein